MLWEINGWFTDYFDNDSSLIFKEIDRVKGYVNNGAELRNQQNNTKEIKWCIHTAFGWCTMRTMLCTITCNHLVIA